MTYCRKQNIDIQLFQKASQLPQSWNDLLPVDHFLQPDHLAIYESVQLPDVNFIYALISQQHKPVGLAYFQVLHIGEHHLNATALKPYQQQLWHLFTSLMRPKLLVAGHLFRHDICSFFQRETITPFDAFGFYREAIKVAMRQTGADAVLVKDVNEQLIPYFQHYAPEYLLLRNDITMEMDIPATWQTILDYESALKHKYAQRFRKVRQGSQNIIINELSVKETERHQAILHRLYTQVTNKQQVRLGLLNQAFLPALKKAYEKELKIWVGYEGSEPVLFFSAWTNGDVLDMFYIGFDYSKNEELQLYFNILFFTVEQAISLRKKKLVLGRTALEAKARLGCRPKYLSTYLYIRNPAIRQVINRLQQNINSMEGEWENRHPFKAKN
ncbi:MAG TPA: hypothetical protein VL093_06455 [Flavipsychrobacter sp.]|nr:hypothetical protein [Flavipsychrobacter sp.]